MNRVIKFRIWDKDQQKYINPTHIYLSVNGELNYDRLRKNLIPEQYTGVKDKNDIDIYEGDIVKYLSYDTWADNGVGKWLEKKTVVKWEEIIGFAPFSWQYECDDHFYSVTHKDYEIIGNIYENPELIK